MENVRKAAGRFPVLDQLETKTEGKVKKEYALLAIGALLLVLTLSTPLGPLLSSTFGILIPLKETLTILKQVKPKEEETRHLMIFWMIFGLLTALDAYSSWLVSFIPLFYTFKFGFLLWAGPLRFKAGTFLYETFISKIPESCYSFSNSDELIRSAGRVASETLKKAEKNISEASNGYKKTESESVKKNE